MSQSSPTLRSLAKACGVSRTTVSLALRNSPKVSLATRSAVQKRAKAMGYEVDANVSKLMGYLRRRRRERALCNLGWIYYGEKETWETPWNRGVLEGAKERAAELGYALEEVWVSAPDFKLARLPQLLRAKGIEGILLPSPSLKKAPIHKHLPWNELQVVVLMSPASLPEFNHVDFHHTDNMKRAITEVLRLGYRRPGLLVSHWLDTNSNWSYSGQILAEHGHYLDYVHLPPFWTEGWHGEAWNAGEFIQWYEREKPDVLFVIGNEWKRLVEASGIRVPEDVGMVHLEWGPDVPEWAGIDPERRYIGYSAVEMLTSALERGEKGIPPFAKETQIRGTWKMGNTLLEKI